MNQEPFFTDTVGVMAVILMIPVFFLWLERTTQWKIFHFLPAIIWIFLTPIFLSNFGVIPRSTPIYTTFRSFAVPLFIVLMLLDINVREALKAWRSVLVMVAGAFGIVIGAAAAFFAFRSVLPPDSWSGFGALAGSWIGGTGNLAAVAESLSTPDEFVGVVVVVDNFVYLAYFPIILTSRHWAGWFNRFTRVAEKQPDRVADLSVESKRQEVHFRHVLTLLGFGFAAILASNYLAKLVPELPPVLTEKTWAMLLVTTIALALSATPLKNVPGTAPLSMTFVYIYMTMIGASADLRELAGAQWFLVAGFVCIAVHFLFIVVAARWFRVDVSMAAVSSVAAVGGMASAPIAAGFHRKELVPVSIMLALVGYALGNFLGVGTALLCHLLA
ncbi:MAG: DUF819 family protein [Acidobacteriota bacterium]|nr:DUF819 family protein [Acidobacteriota bacterium]